MPCGKAKRSFLARGGTTRKRVSFDTEDGPVDFMANVPRKRRQRVEFKARR